MGDSHAGPRHLAAIPTPVLLGATMLLLGSSYNVTDVALGHAGPGAVAVGRAVGAALFVLPVLPLLGARLPRSATGWIWATAIGVANVSLVLIAINEATGRAGPALAAVLINSSPFFMTVLARLVLGERPSALRYAGLAVGFSGVLLILLAEPLRTGSGLSLVAGIALGLAGAFAAAAAGLGIRHLTLTEQDFDVLGMSAASFVTGAVFVLPYGLVVDDPGATDWGSGGLWLALVALGLGGLALPITGLFIALSRWESARVYAWTFLVPAIATLIEVARGNPPAALEAAGIVVVTLGVAIVSLPQAERRAPAAAG